MYGNGRLLDDDRRRCATVMDGTQAPRLQGTAQRRLDGDGGQRTAQEQRRLTASAIVMDGNGWYDGDLPVMDGATRWQLDGDG